MRTLADLFKLKSPPLIGLDISASSVKMVELAPAGRGELCLQAYAIEPLPRDAVADGSIVNLEATTEAIRRCYKRLGSRVRNVAMAVPAAAVITKKIVCAADMPEAELEATVESEAVHYIPFALEEVNLDFQVLDRLPGSPDLVEVLVAASRKEKIEDRIAAAEGAGLTGLLMDVESFALQTAFELVRPRLPAQVRDQCVAVVDIGSAITQVSVIRGDSILFSREQAFGGNQINAEIQRLYGLSIEEAETAKRGGGLPQGYHAEVVEPFMQAAALEVQRALQFFFSASEYGRVDHIVLAGGCAALTELEAVVASRTRVATLVANPFAKMQISSRLQLKRLVSDAPALMIACGLAMRRFDA
jgi:type IV pilus assembly protein PilM